MVLKDNDNNSDRRVIQHNNIYIYIYITIMHNLSQQYSTGCGFYTEQEMTLKKA